MELILTLAMKFWMWTILIALIIIGFIVNLFDKKQQIIHIRIYRLSLMKPIRIVQRQRFLQ